ncbi:MAG: tetratricopeptide repeat protein [Acidobacteria bacterium]|nr:tetratricopeptide repeat protein [Acidobacteriota bacterium]
MGRLLLPGVAVFATALTVRVVHIWQMRDTLFFSVLMGDSRGYDAWARQIAAGEWLGREVFYQAPLYPYFLGVVYTVFGHDLLAVRLIQAVLGACGCAALASAGSKLISPPAGLIAGLMLALYPPAVFFDGLVQKSVLDVLLVCLSLALVAQIARDTCQLRPWGWLGVAMGALSLTRENALVLVAVVAVWAMQARSVRSLGVFTAGLALVLVPVAARNYAVGGGFYLTTSQFGSNLYIGNNAQADGSYMSLREGRGSPEFERLDATELAERARGRALTPSEVSRYWTDQTFAYVRAQPGDWLALLARKMRLLLSGTEVIDTESQESHAEYSSPLRWLSPVWHYGLLLPLGILGAASLWRQRQRLWPVYAMTFAYAASVVLFFVVARYRLPLVPFLTLFAAAGLLSRPRAVVVAVAAAAAIVANWPLYTAASQQAITENNLGTALQESGRPAEAIDRYKRALALDPNYAPAMNNLGTALRAAGRAGEAVTVYDQALAKGSDRATIRLNRGHALLAAGRIEEAIGSLREAVALDPEMEAATTSLANALYDQGTSALEAGALAAATGALREAIRIKPDYAEAHNNLGIALASDGKINEAIVEWEAALRIKPDFADAARNLQRARP